MNCMHSLDCATDLTLFAKGLYSMAAAEVVVWSGYATLLCLIGMQRQASQYIRGFESATYSRSSRVSLSQC